MGSVSVCGATGSARRLRRTFSTPATASMNASAFSLQLSGDSLFALQYFRGLAARPRHAPWRVEATHRKQFSRSFRPSSTDPHAAPCLLLTMSFRRPRVRFSSWSRSCMSVALWLTPGAPSSSVPRSRSRFSFSSARSISSRTLASCSCSLPSSALMRAWMWPSSVSWRAADGAAEVAEAGSELADRCEMSPSENCGSTARAAISELRPRMPGEVARAHLHGGIPLGKERDLAFVDLDVRLGRSRLSHSRRVLVAVRRWRKRAEASSRTWVLVALPPTTAFRPVMLRVTTLTRLLQRTTLAAQPQPILRPASVLVPRAPLASSSRAYATQPSHLGNLSPAPGSAHKVTAWPSRHQRAATDALAAFDVFSGNASDAVSVRGAAERLDGVTRDRELARETASPPCILREDRRPSRARTRSAASRTRAALAPASPYGC